MRDKALKCAIHQLENTFSREAARLAYVDWKCFWNDKEYRAAVERLQEKLKEKR